MRLRQKSAGYASCRHKADFNIMTQSHFHTYPLKNILFFFVIGVLLFLYTPVEASIYNRLHRVEIRPKSTYTRLSLQMEQYTPAKIDSLSDNRIRIALRDTNGPLFKKYRKYSDRNMGGLVFTQRGDELIITFKVANGAGWRSYNFEGVENLTIDIGESFAKPPILTPPVGREKIFSGIGKLVKDFDPPFKTDIPFTPTDRQLLAKLLPAEEQQVFSAGEAALYKSRFTEAEEIITPFSLRETPIKALALYRLGEVWYNLQKYPQALAAFREAERLWPAFLQMNPAVTFFYGDSIVRSGDFEHGRVLLAQLIGRLSDKKFAPTLLIRLGDIYSRHGYEKQATGLYSIVADNFAGNKAKQMAQMRLNDQLFMRANSWNYRSLSRSYYEISEKIGDFDMREEAHFKYVLLESLHGDALVALHDITAFQRKFPRGAYTTVARVIREALVAQVYRETDWSGNPSGFIRFVEEQQEYLTDCVELPGFLNMVTKSYEQAGNLIEKVRLLSYILERQWATASAPAIYEEIAEHANLIGDSAFATKTLRSMLRKYPNHPRKKYLTEHLASLLYNDAKYADVKQTLAWLLNKKERAQLPDSYYFLAKSLLKLNDYSPSIKAFDLFISSVSPSNIYLADAYYTAATLHESNGDRIGALKLIDKGLTLLPKDKQNEAMLYKAGQLNLQIGNMAKGKNYLEPLAKNGKDLDWKRLAQQALDTAKAAPTK